MAKTKEKSSKRYSVTDPGTYHTDGKKAETLLKDTVEEIKFNGYSPHEITEIAIKYGKMLTGVPLYGYQEPAIYRALYSIITNEGAMLSMIWARQSGKSESLAFIIDVCTTLFPALSKVFTEFDEYKDGFKVGLFAPQSDQVWMTYNRALYRIDNENAEMILSDPDINATLTKTSKYELTNHSSLTGQVASKQSKIEGATYHLIICEEAQDIDSFILQKSIMPMGAAVNSTIIKCGTTGQEKNDFYYTIQMNKSEQRKIKDPRLYLHYEYNYKEVIKYKRQQYEIDGKIFHLKYEQFVEKQAKYLGRESQAFRLAYALEWDLESGMLITDKDWEHMLDRRSGFSIDDDDIVIGGLDIGKEDAPSTLVFAKLVWDPDDESGLPTKEVCGFVEFEHGMDYEVQHHEIVAAIHEYRCVNLVADYTGVGKPVVDRLSFAVNGVCNIEPFTFSTQSKSDMWINLMTCIQSGRLVVPANKTVRATPEFHKFEDQMRNCTKRFNGPYVVAEKPPGGNDEYCDALSLMCLADNFEIPVEVEEDVNPFY